MPTRRAFQWFAILGSEEIAAGVVNSSAWEDGTEVTVDRKAVAEKAIAMLR